MGDLDPPSMPDGAEDRLLFVPSDPTDLDVVVPAEIPCGGRGDPAVYQDTAQVGR